MINARHPNLVDLSRLSVQLGLPSNWLEQEAEHERIPRLAVTYDDGSRRFLFNPTAVRDCLAMRAALGDKPPAREPAT